MHPFTQVDSSRHTEVNLKKYIYIYTGIFVIKNGMGWFDKHDNLKKRNIKTYQSKSNCLRQNMLIGDLTIKNIPHIPALAKRRAGDRKRIESDKEIHSNVRPLTTGKRSSI